MVGHSIYVLMGSPFFFDSQIFSLDPFWIYAVFLVSIRLAVVLIMTPVLYAFPVPTVVRIVLVMSLSVVLTLAFSSLHITAPLEIGSMIAAAISELVLGATLGLGILLAFAAFAIAGSLLDGQIGYGMGQIIDPVSHRQLPVLTSMFNWLAVVVFFMVNGHHALMRGLAYSLEHFPPGHAWQFSGAITPILRQVAGL